MNQKIIFNIKDLSLYYKNNCAFQNISMPIYKNKITVLVGRSGSGKSSFLRCLNLLCEMDSCCKASGHVYFHNQDILSTNTDRVIHRRKVGMVFQEPNPFPFSIKKNIELPLRELRIYKKAEIQKISQDVLMQVGLWDEVKDRLNNSALELSGGQQQRLCLARSLALKPEVLLMDEPTSSLDPHSTSVIEDLIMELKNQTTIVLVTHDVTQAQKLADYTAFFGSPQSTSSLVDFSEAKKDNLRTLTPQFYHPLPNEI